VSDDTDNSDNNVVQLPTRNGDSGGMPDAPDIGDLFYSEPPDDGPDDGVPPESPEGTATGIPAIRAPISPETALREAGMPNPPDSEESESDDGEEGGEYVQRRSLADRLGDWLELRLGIARDRHAGEAVFREAEIARKTALLEARTASETAMIEQNGKLATAMTKARADKAAARGKADADRARASASGMGADKGGRSKTNNGTGSGGSGGAGRGPGGRGPGTNGPNSGAGRGPGGGTSPKSPGKGPDRSNGSRGNGAKNDSPGGPRGRRNGPGGSRGEGGRSPNAAADSRADRSRARRERSAARQAAREQRRNTQQAADLADRSKDREQDRARREAARQERRAAKAERQAARKAKRDAAAAASADRTSLGAALVDEAGRRWDKRRKGPQKGPEKDREKDRPGRDKDAEATTKKLPKDGPEAASDGPKAASPTKEPKDGKNGRTQPAEGSGGDGKAEGPGAESGDEKRFRDWVKDQFNRPDPGPDTASGAQDPTGTGTAKTAKSEDFGFTVDSPGRPSRPPEPEPEEEDIPDADIVDDPADPFGAYVTRSASLPRAPEPHTQRPGTSRPTPQEEQPVASQVSKPATGQAGMPAKHRTDITFGEYLTEIVNIAIAAGMDKERGRELADALGKVADALRDMAADLVGDHNIDTDVVNQIRDTADGAARMKRQAEQCAIDCELASEAARLAATAVGRTYSQDIQAMDDAGLAQASAAAHHD
jgi:hypothetical protein